MDGEIEKNCEVLFTFIFNLAKSQVPAGKRALVSDGIQAQAVLEKAAKKFDRSLPGRAPDTELAVNHLFGLAYFLQNGDVIESDQSKIEVLCDAYLTFGFISAKLSRPRELSKLGESGARKRHAPMRKLEAWAIEKYKAGEWKSANQAAHALKESVIKHGRTINAHLSEENAQTTIARWLRKSV